jgi:hypothetical protein
MGIILLKKATLPLKSFPLENDLRNLINSIKYDLKSKFIDQRIKVTAFEDLAKKLINLRYSINFSFSSCSNFSDFRKNN